MAEELVCAIYSKTGPCQDTRNVARQHLRNIKNFETVFALFATTLRRFWELSARGHGQGESFIGMWKDHSRLGYDVIKGRSVDYGNFEMKIFAMTVAMHDQETQRVLEVLGEMWPTMHPTNQDTMDSVGNVGDIVEVHMGVLRGHGRRMGIDLNLEDDDCRMAFVDFCQVMRMIHVMDAMFVRGQLKYVQRHMQQLPETLPAAPNLYVFRNLWIASACLPKARLLRFVLMAKQTRQH